MIKRYRSVLVVLLFACSPLTGIGGEQRMVVCPSSAENPRNSEGDIVVLNDGTLLLAWTQFTGREDHATAEIAARTSRDEGNTWSKPFVVQENIGKQNVMSVSFLRLQSGTICLFFLVKNADNDLQVYMRQSDDEANTWSPPKAITHKLGYHIMNNARAIQLSNGRILLPIAFTPDIRKHYNDQVCLIYYSDDDGITWAPSNDTVSLDGSPAMEPGLAELKNGDVWMIIRTKLDRIYQAVSQDGGNSWSDPRPTSLTAPAAPSTVSRIPNTGDLLMVWNNNPLGDKAGWKGRTPLTIAVSKNNGQTWSLLKNIEDDPHSGFGYTSVTWMKDSALLTYYHWNDSNPNFQLTDLIFRRIDGKDIYNPQSAIQRQQ